MHCLDEDELGQHSSSSGGSKIVVKCFLSSRPGAGLRGLKAQSHQTPDTKCATPGPKYRLGRLGHITTCKTRLEIGCPA